MSLIAVIGKKGLNGKKLSAQVQDAIDGGATMIMVKEPQGVRYSEYFQEAMEVRMTIGSSDIPLIVYDEEDIASGLGTDGIHMELDGIQIGDMRDMMGTGKIIGVTVKDRLVAKAAQKQGADYLLVGPMFKSMDSLSVTNGTITSSNSSPFAMWAVVMTTPLTKATLSSVSKQILSDK